MKTIIIFIGIAFTLTRCLIAGGEKDLFRDLVEVAREEALLGQFTTAARNYEEAISQPVKPDEKLDVYYELATLYSDDLADTARALDTYLMIARMYDGSDRVDVALYRIGNILEELGECHNAVGYYEKLIVGYPSSGYVEYALEGSERCFHKNFKEAAAVVHGEPITVMELEAAIEALPLVYKGRYSTPQGKKEYLEKMIRDRIVEQTARDLGFLDDPEIVAKVNDAKMRILNEHFFLTQVREKVQVNDEEIEEYYQAHRQDYIKPEEIRVRHILTETEEEAESILQDLKAGRNFEDMAADFSIDMRTNEKGGDLGYITRGRTVKEVEEVAFSLEPGEVSDVVKSRFGYHIVKVEDRRPETYRSIDEMRELVVSEVRRIKEEQKSKDLMTELKNRYGVKVFDEKDEIHSTSTGEGERQE